MAGSYRVGAGAVTEVESGDAVRVAVIARRHRHLTPELTAEMARVAEAPAVGNGGDRQSRAHEIVARRCKPMRSHHGTDGVAGRSESPVHGAGGDGEGTR